MTDYHFGGYAKSTPVLDAFIREFMERHGIPLEFIYTGKMMSGIFDLASKGFFEKGSTVLAIHTGGLRRVNLRLIVLSDNSLVIRIDNSAHPLPQRCGLLPQELDAFLNKLIEVEIPDVLSRLFHCALARQTYQL